MGRWYGPVFWSFFSPMWVAGLGWAGPDLGAESGRPLDSLLEILLALEPLEDWRENSVTKSTPVGLLPID